jgi:Gram-negative bacterial TonB protein C-terminal
MARALVVFRSMSLFFSAGRRVCSVAAYFLFAGSCCVVGQTTSSADPEFCAIQTVSESTRPFYPPIAKAAHVEGAVVLLVSFKSSGEVEGSEVVSGPPMLVPNAITFVQGWRANEDANPRKCRIVVTFVSNQAGTEDGEERRIDPQHVNVYAQVPCLCDPPATITVSKRRRWYWPF